MSISHPAIHPVTEAGGGEGTVGLGTEENNNNNNMRTLIQMKDIEGSPGTLGGMALRLSQFLFAALALSVMASTSDFPSVTSFCFLVAAAGLQCLWSLSLAIVDIHALLVGRCLHNCCLVRFFALGDGITSTLTFAAACASAGITVLIDNDLGLCGQNHCTQFETATAMTFLSWFASLPSFFLNFWSLASR